MHKKIIVGIWMCMVLVLCACTQTAFEGSRIKNETECLLTYTKFHGKERHEMFLNEGEQVKILISQEKGNLKLSIGMPKEEKIYRGEILADCEFRVGVPQSGMYEIEITAERAAGSIHVIKEAE